METAVRSTSMGEPLGTPSRKSDHRAAECPRLGDQIGLAADRVRLLGQPAVPEQPDDFFEGGVLRQRMDVVAAVAEDARVSVDITNLGFAGDDAFQTRARAKVVPIRLPKLHCSASAAKISEIVAVPVVLSSGGSRAAGRTEDETATLHPKLFGCWLAGFDGDDNA